ncbi:hypothetical protein DQ04_05291000 [Trypanosoma grayi]|uniref:hypothetical protein n=1 Tax=Trypanosoma grayi TaxID=71804 RepID=UPI0004F40748|nr:hypothetical protein DQ04_05291000 [Trypanosoma grayi]KEG09393.1 hypothetical protein DQ04_05291000 [Trypanosoma grayi]
MSVGVQREEWDVTFLLPKEQRAVYPRVPLHNIGDVAELTRDAVATSLKMRRYASSPNTDGHCLVPGFLVYHFSPRELQHLGPVLLQPDGMSWASLCQRQGGVASMLLQIVPLNDHTNAPGKGATPVNEDPVRSGGGGAGDLPLRPPAVGAVELQQSTSSIAGEPVSPLQDDDAIGAPADKNSEKVKRVATRFLPEEHERLYSSESKFRLPDPSLVLARLREQNSLQSRSRDRFPQKLPHGGVSGSTPTTSVRVFALTYVLARVQSILSKSEARERDTGRPQPAITREGILYFAAALVKYWQTKLLLSPVAMEKAWESLPPLIRNAQCDYLRNSVYSFWKQLCEAQQLDERSPKGTQTSRQKSLQDFGRAPPPQASPSFCTNSSGETEVEEVVLVKEVTYCSSTGPLPLPVGSMANGKLAVTLSAPPQVNVNEEVVIVGHLLSRNSVGLFWWGVESISTSQAAELVFQSGESSTLLSLDTLYRQGRLTTFQVTPNTFILTMKSWSLRPSRHYRFVVEVCDVRIGEVAVSEVRLWTL